MERLIVLDTETTGFSPADGDRIVEIGCVELIDMRVGAHKQWYINPERDIPQEAIDVHGITNEQVADAPKFHEIAQEFLDFVGDSKMVIHNATFDMRFLNAELKKDKRPPLPDDQAIDTLPMARRTFPGKAASLDALCRRYGIDNSRRNFHGALLDSQLLAEVYVELTGGNQFAMELSDTLRQKKASVEVLKPLTDIPKRHWPIPQHEADAHLLYLDMLQSKSGACIWLEDK
ncbi:MAG: DNA polymerase III subunit epsilon [Magnetococcales bacterium]|nr:DNA polymerase III subunit epsilon [Magnetococcales bacterium]